jgi:superoxide dismutase, Fe-Mn family
MIKKFELQKLAYEYNSLEPFFDEETMRIHHDKHHRSYMEKFNKGLENHPEFYDESAEELLRKLYDLPKDILLGVKNNGGGYVNHNFFWSILGKDKPFNGLISEAIIEKFGSYEEFKKVFSETALNQFGSGWAWLVLNNKGDLEVIKTSNQDSPLTDDKIPLLALDVWEHAYYLKYQNKRAEFAEAFFNVINWEKVNHLYTEALRHLECR